MILLERTGEVEHSSIWLKAVTAVDLTHHCIESLIGERLPVDRHKQVQRIEVDVPAPAYYLCSVSQPYNLATNGHFFLFVAPGEEHEVEQPGLVATLFGLRHLPVQASWLQDPGQYGHDRYFTTCRNLQAAHFLHHQGGLDNRRNTERDRWRNKAPKPGRVRQPALFDR